MPKITTEKKVPHLSSGITYTAWSNKILKEHPVTKEHLNGFIWIAGKPKTSKDVLVHIKQAGEKSFPEGGFIIRERGLPYLTHHFPDAVRSFPVKKKRGRKPKKAVNTIQKGEKSQKRKRKRKAKK